MPFFFIFQMSNFAAISKLGVQAAQSGNMYLAEKYFRQAAELEGEPPEAIFNLCRLLHMQGKNQNVIDTFKKKIAKKDYPHVHPQLLLIASQSAIRCGNKTLAIDALTTLHVRHPENSETSILLSTLQIEAGRLNEATQTVKTTMRLSGRGASLLTNLAICETEMGSIEQAERIHQEIIKNNPKEFLAYYNYGKMLATIGETSSAKKLFQKCLDINPNAPEALDAINQIEPKGTIFEEFYAKIASGDHHEAANLLRRSINNNNTNNYLSCICHLKTNYRSQFGEIKHFSPKHMVQKWDLSLDQSIDLNSLYHLVKNNESLIKDRPGKPTIKGFQTYEILKNSTNHSAELLCAKIKILAREYCKTQNIPSIKFNESMKAELSGWGVILNIGGHQKLHTHPESILSGVIYLKTSLETESEEKECGNIIFPSSEALSISPYQGLMILFPSYLPHLTIPTIQEDERVCIAFNVNYKGITE